MTISELGHRLAQAYTHVYEHSDQVDVFSIKRGDRKCIVVVVDESLEPFIRAAVEKMLPQSKGIPS